MRQLKIAAFAAFVVVILVLAVTTLLDVLTGVKGTADAVYSSAPFCVMWAVLFVLATAYIVRRRLWRMPATMGIHAALLVILIGALTTHLFGQQGTLHLRKGERQTAFVLRGSHSSLPWHRNSEALTSWQSSFPFTVELDTFYVSYYPGTTSPCDFTTRLRITPNDNDTVLGQLSMNRIYTYRHYRFYQSGYDPDLEGTKLSIAHDPYGIAITYTGYALLLLSMIAFFFQRKGNGKRNGKSKDKGKDENNNESNKNNSASTSLSGGHNIIGGAILFGLLFAQPFISGARVAAATQPKIAPTDVAVQFADLFMEYNGRICPVGTYAHDFTTKLYGSPTYRHRQAEEILAGWLFFPDTWKGEPMIRLKGGAVKRAIGVDGSYASLRDFANVYGEYKLQPLLVRINSGESVDGAADLRAADEKIGIINSVFTGSAMKIFPVRSPEGTVRWYSSIDPLPDHLAAEKQLFIRKALNLVAEKIVMRRYTEAKELIAKIKQYQIAEAGGTTAHSGVGQQAAHSGVGQQAAHSGIGQQAAQVNTLPSDFETKAEKLYNRIASSKPWAMTCLTIGILAFIYMMVCGRKRNVCEEREADEKKKADEKRTADGTRKADGIRQADEARIVNEKRKTDGIMTADKRRIAVAVSLNIVATIVFLYLSLCIALRLIISHHLPISNGYETMHILAWVCLIITFVAQRAFALALPYGFIVSGLALLVAMIGEGNPAVTSLTPVLNSPLLSLHVMTIMIAYALLAFCMLNGLVALLVKREAKALARTSLQLLPPAVFLLAAGIFVGAVWANVSWGRYWGWDAKEVWALITMMLYALPLHADSLPWFRRERNLHLYLVLAFLSVLMTYFGANFFLAGLHSYA